ncbi:MAG TPA: hypothetical protein VK177_15270 [Flavobacteriales bacterium]|nr:hypothetical protein [Flavobacteriales bacterium]
MKTILCTLLTFTTSTTFSQNAGNQTLANNDTVRNKVQLSISPGFDIVKTTNNETVKKASVNLLVGYAKGIDGFQVSSLVNICNGNARFFQGSGLVNVTNGNFDGFQGAGLINVVSKKTTGMQGAGLINVSIDSVTGMQGAGLANACIKHVEGAQIAGLFNYATSVNGAQLGGLFNCGGNVKGSQIAGLFNVAKNVTGSQISGLINVADSVSGASIAFFSFIRKGYHKLELSADEVFYTNVAFRTGTDKFHNIFSIGVTPEKKNKQLWTCGYGIGSSIKLKEKLWLDIDVSANNVLKVNSPLWGTEDSTSLNNRNGRLNLNNKLHVGVEWRFAKKISVSGGPVFNLMLADERNANYQDVFSKVRPNYLINQKVSNHIFMNVWVGARLAVRFF